MRSLILSGFFLVSNLFLSADLQAVTETPARARDLTTTEKLGDFSELNGWIDSQYGPLVYKNTVRGININEIRKSYTQKITDAKSNAEFYYLLIQYISEYKDGHFGGRIPSDLSFSLPIMTELVDGKILIDQIDRKKLTEAQFPFVKGDEIVTVDGQSAEEFLNFIAPYVSWGNEATDKKMASRQVFRRSATAIPAPLTDSITVQIRRGTSNIIENFKMKWNVSGTPLDELATAPRPSPFSLLPKGLNYDLISIREELNNTLGADRVERSYQCSGTTRVSIPADATILITDPFVAYFHPTAKGNVGYLRIPHYFPTNSVTGAPAFKETFAQYQWAVDQLQKNTVGLVIDQDHNCGGSVSYLEDLVGLFVNQPVLPMQFQLKASKNEYLQFKTWLAETVPNSIERDEITKVIDLIKKSWFEGLFLTPKTAISGRKLIQPNEVNYTKPIVVLADEVSGSGGDAFPSLMQGYGRATLVGTRTSGLGGHVQEMPNLGYSGLSVRMTKSLFFRPDGVPVENNGASPDVPYSITRDDFLYQYKNYQSFYLDVLSKKIQ